MSYLTSWLVYLGVLAAAVSGTLQLRQAGLPEWIAVAAVTTLAGAVVLALQRAWGARDEWRRYGRDLAVDVLHAIVSTGAVSAVARALLLGILVAASALLAQHAPVALWPNEWPIFFQLALALLIGDFGAYWVHRLAHESEALWKIHALHHTAEHLYGINSARNHPLNVALSYLASVGPLVALGASAEVLMASAVFTSVHGVLQHSNMDLRLGVLEWVMAGPGVHRWHHSAELEESQTNYGSNLIVWDIVFGTRFRPANREPARIGLPDWSVPKNFLVHLSTPFRYAFFEVPERTPEEATPVAETLGVEPLASRG